MVLGKLPVPGRPASLITVGQGPIALAVSAGGGGLDIFISSILSPLSPSLWETARYRPKYCLKGPLNPKQPTNQPKIHSITLIPFEIISQNLVEIQSITRRRAEINNGHSTCILAEFPLQFSL